MNMRIRRRIKKQEYSWELEVDNQNNNENDNLCGSKDNKNNRETMGCEERAMKILNKLDYIEKERSRVKEYSTVDCSEVLGEVR